MCCVDFFLFFFLPLLSASTVSTPLSREAEGEIKLGQQKGRRFFSAGFSLRLVREAARSFKRHIVTDLLPDTDYCFLPVIQVAGNKC